MTFHKGQMEKIKGTRGRKPLRNKKGNGNREPSNGLRQLIPRGRKCSCDVVIHILTFLKIYNTTTCIIPGIIENLDAFYYTFRQTSALEKKTNPFGNVCRGNSKNQMILHNTWHMGS